MIHFTIQQHAARLPDESSRPYGVHSSTEDAHWRVQTRPPEEESAGQRGNGEHRGGGIRNDVDVSGSQIRIVLIVRRVMVVCIMMVMVRVAEDQRANDVDREPDRCDDNGLEVLNGLG